MLHLISLGWFKYCLEAFSSQAGGPGSIALKQYDRLRSMIGQQLSRQSDRDIPRTNFPKGISSTSNLVGHKIAGCLLLKLFALHTKGYQCPGQPDILVAPLPGTIEDATLRKKHSHRPVLVIIRIIKIIWFICSQHDYHLRVNYSPVVLVSR